MTPPPPSIAARTPRFERVVCTNADEGTPLPDQADARLTALDEQGEITARSSLWWRSTPPHAGHRVGLIGHYMAHDRGSADLLLSRACQQLAARGCSLAVGPMDGNTWRNYRFITDRGVEPGFLTEPQNPPEWPAQFEDNQFVPLARYCSSINTQLDFEHPKSRAASERLSRLDVRLRTLNATDYETELRRIHSICTTSFVNNFLYSPISQSEFLNQYLPLGPLLRPELVWIAEHAGRVVGFIFMIPDLNQARQNRRPDTAIIKTLAILPERQYTGLGGMLTARAQRTARDCGFERVIHALMHEANPSVNLSSRYACPFRRYALFARHLNQGLDPS